jgi:hypothetical protein
MADFNHLSDLLKAIHDGTVLGVREATKTVRDDYAGYVAVDTGFTKSAAYMVTSDTSTYGQAVGHAQSIDSFREVLPEIGPPDDDTTGIAADAAASAWFLEHGTSRMAAQPAMQPAAEAMRGKLHGIMAKNIARAVKGVVR